MQNNIKPKKKINSKKIRQPKKKKVSEKNINEYSKFGP